MNIMPKHEEQATVASFDSQYWQRGESEEMAAPQFGQLRVSAVIRRSARNDPGSKRGSRAGVVGRAVRGHLARFKVNICTSNETRKNLWLLIYYEVLSFLIFAAIWIVRCWTEQTVVCDS